MEEERDGDNVSHESVWLRPLSSPCPVLSPPRGSTSGSTGGIDCDADGDDKYDFTCA